MSTSTEDLSSHLAESGVTIRSDSEQYSPGDELSPSTSSDNSPVILYSPPTAWSVIRGVAINLVLPFINGMMLGFGELFAHEAAFRLGWGGTKNRTNRSSWGHGRHFGTSLRKSGGTSPFRPTFAAAPTALGGMTTSRNLTIWGWMGDRKRAPAVEEGNAQASASAQASSPAPPPEAAVEPSVNEAADPLSEAAVPTTEIDIESIINAEDILNMPEDLGYLHAIGLDYGWGFTSMMQWALEHVHIYSGLGWGASIMATAFLLRAVMFYPQIQSLRFNAVMQQLRKDPRSQEALKLVQKGFQDRDMEARQRGQVMNKLLRKEYGVSNWGILWGFMQIPFTFGLFRIVSGMTHVPVPALEGSGYLWFTDLTATDPYFILPAVGTALMTGALMVNSKYSPPQQQKMLKTLMYVFGVVGFVGTTFLSSAVNLMTVALGASTLVTSLVLNVPSIRRSLGLPLASAGASTQGAARRAMPTYEAPKASTGVREQLTNSLNDMKKGLSESVSNYTGTYQGSEAEKAERKRKDMLRKLEEMRRQQEREDFERKYKGK